ncbi:hypothetical protein [Paucibacter soli]|uniref:hypothetical protein n=1 Tax=Paucibacter soli TaxID=3133433 RepID=UPI0030B198C6
MSTSYTSMTKILRQAQIKAVLLMAVAPCLFGALAGQARLQNEGLMAMGLMLCAAVSLLLGAKQEPKLRRIEEVRTRVYRHETKLARRYGRLMPL